MTKLKVQSEDFPIAGVFTISRGSRTEARVVTATLSDGTHQGRGECVPYTRYGESVESVIDLIDDCATDIENGMNRKELQERLPSGAARNALDNAFWDLQSKQTGKPIWQLAGLPKPKPVMTAYTLSVDTPDNMFTAAEETIGRPLLKIKLTGDDIDLARVEAVNRANPKAQLILDANEAWSLQQLDELIPEFANLNVALIEQPLPASNDRDLADIKSPIPLCADESAHDTKTFAQVAPLYDAINIKLDKTGGLTEAIKLAKVARVSGMKIMVGCMVGTSLGMAPATLLSPWADFVDLDGPLLLAKDRENGLRYEGSLMYPPSADLWGQ